MCNLIIFTSNILNLVAFRRSIISPHVVVLQCETDCCGIVYVKSLDFVQNHRCAAAQISADENTHALREKKL